MISPSPVAAPLLALTLAYGSAQVGTQGAPASAQPATDLVPTQQYLPLFHDGDRISFELNVPNTNVCIIVPSDRRDPAGCKGLNPEALEQVVATDPRRQNMVGVAVLKHGEGEAFFFVARLGQELAEIDPKDVETVARDLLTGASRSPGVENGGMRAAAPATVQRVGAVQVIRTRGSHDTDHGPFFTDMFIVLAAGTAYGFSFDTPFEGLRDIEPVEEQIIQSVRATPTHLRSGAPKSADEGEHVGYYVGGALLVILVPAMVAAGWYLTRKRSRRAGNS